MRNVIDQFTGEYAFLSNFYYSDVVLNSVRYPTLEHAFQAAKTLDAIERGTIAVMERPGSAKAYGRKVKMREGWEEMKVGIMYGLLCQKFAKGSRLAGMLITTGDALLVEGNSWHDNFWGVDFRTPEKGQNWLGKLLMQRREEIR